MKIKDSLGGFSGSKGLKESDTDNRGQLQSENDVIEELNRCGIPVVTKPVALVRNGGSDGEFGAYIEMDIYKALNMVKHRKRIIGDPFS